MKRQSNNRKPTAFFYLALAGAGCAAWAQDPGNGPGPGDGGPPRHGPPPLPPIIRALDTNRDGIIEADEIANAPQSLKTLEKSGSNQLTIQDLLGPPPPPPDHPGWGPGPANAPEGSGTQSADADAQNGPPPPDGPPPGPPPGPGGHHRLPPVIEALDTNHDGIIEADEIANAAQSLKTLDKNGAGQLTIPELLGPPPHRPRNGDDGPPGPPPCDNGPGDNPPPAESGTNAGGPPPPPTE
jgi:hypothetical protein